MLFSAISSILCGEVWQLSLSEGLLSSPDVLVGTSDGKRKQWRAVILRIISSCTPSMFSSRVSIMHINNIIKIALFNHKEGVHMQTHIFLVSKLHRYVCACIYESSRSSRLLWLICQNIKTLEKPVYPRSRHTAQQTQ